MVRHCALSAHVILLANQWTFELVWPSKWGPSYWRSNLISACCFLVAIGTALVIRLVLVRRNRDLDRRHGTVEQVQAGNENLEEAQQRAMSARQTYRYLI